MAVCLLYICVCHSLCLLVSFSVLYVRLPGNLMSFCLFALFVCLSVFLSVRLFFYVHMFWSLCMCLLIACSSVYPSVYLLPAVCLLFLVSVHSCQFMNIYLPACLYFMPFCLHVCLFICLSVHELLDHFIADKFLPIIKNNAYLHVDTALYKFMYLFDARIRGVLTIVPTHLRQQTRKINLCELLAYLTRGVCAVCLHTTPPTTSPPLQ